MDVPEAEIRAIMKYHDLDDNGGIDFAEFKDIFNEKKVELKPDEAIEVQEKQE
jgi:Ca2+-binding EF-hand superfamily protein